MGEESFYAERINDALFDVIHGNSYREDCTIPREDLRCLHVLHKDWQGNVRQGELICHAYIVHDLLDIFQKLYLAAYPIEKVRLIDVYGADDECSMRDNNSSCFNFRFISHTKRISKHGLGLAVDINPLYNPYCKEVDGRRVIEPGTAEPYLDRRAKFPYKIEREDLCCRLFAMHGFAWGGDWQDRKDYQHFEIPDDMVAMMYGNEEDWK